MAVSLADFRSRFPEFESTADAAVEARLAEAAEIHSVRASATLYCCAHLLSLASDTTTQPDAGAGEVASEGIGQERITYRTQAEDGWEAFFSTTRYGRTFLLLERRTPSIAMAARVIG